MLTDIFKAGMGMGVPSGRLPFPPCPIPLDSGIILLFVVGLMFGCFKIYSYIKNN